MYFWFRECLGGIHKKFGVNPDVLMLGKALGNGYAITAVLGKKNQLNSIKKTFISSTFWTGKHRGTTPALRDYRNYGKEKKLEVYYKLRCIY